MTTDITFQQPPPAPVSLWKAGRAYWACQVAGWTLMFVLNLIASLAVMPFHWRYVLVNAAVSIVGLSVTHTVRAISRARRWEQLPFPQLLPRAALAIVGCVAVTLLIFFAADGAGGALFGKRDLFGPEPRFNWLAGAFLVMSANLSAIYLTWCGIYYGVQLLRRQQSAETERWRLQAALSSAELGALKAQLNPHFLFNALNGLRGLIVEDPARAQHVVTRLAAILRYSLQASERETVSLGEELRMVDDYLELEGVRFEERLRVVRDIAEDVMAIDVPPMVVQTLVENAIKYGVSRDPQPSDVSIAARLDGDTLEVKIGNTGSITPLNNGTGVGLRNAADRIHRLWGEAASLRLAEDRPGHVTATLRIPR
jgi:hypothetical protein